MAGELLSFGVQKLWDLLSQEYAHFQGVDDQVAELKSDLNLLNSFLKDAYAKKHTSAMVRNCVEEIKGIIWDAEDIIETFLLKEKIGKSGIKKRIRRFACVFPDRREIALDIGGISKRISKMISVMQSFGIQQIISDGGYMQPLHDRQREMRQEFARENESNLVGLEANVEKLVGYLAEDDNVQVVSMTGMGGLGKTTLARQAFNHEMVKNKFDRLAWVCVSQDFKLKNVWQTILQNFKPEEEKKILDSFKKKRKILEMNEPELHDELKGEDKKILEMTESELHAELFGLLETSKSLIVFDDIWKEEDWGVIKRIFPPKKGWKVLLTSRNENVAGRGDTTYINFKPGCLTIEDSWTLFQTIAMPRKDASQLKEVDQEMEEMGTQMIKHCGGLPLAIRVLGGLLATKYTLHDWERISENIGSHLMGRKDPNDDNNSSFYHVLSMSFEELPNYLKDCFLYLAHFPEDYEISMQKLSYCWDAEGILRYHEGETIRDVGDVYIEELVRRNMVISERDVKTLRFETCHLHDMMREICLSKAKEENFLQIVGIWSQAAHSQTRSTSRRFVSQNPTTLHVERDINNSKVRSLVVVTKGFRGGIWELPSLSFARLQLLRVLDFSTVKFKGRKLPYSIGKLIHLRYLNLEGAWVSHLPYSLRNLKLLIYLNLGVYGYRDVFVPNVLMGMKELRYLELPMFMHEKTKLELSNLEKLETLKNFSTKNSSLEDLRRMSRLRTLGIILTEEEHIESLSASIGGLRHLEDISIQGFTFVRKTEMEFIDNFVHLKQLHLSLYMTSLPKPFPSHLTTISLEFCRLEEDPMPILDKLPQLKEVSLLFNAFSGRRMDCSAGGFPQLQKLWFSRLGELEEWIVEEGSMPLLHTLSIDECSKLKELPAGLQYITSLKDLNMGEGWKERLSEGGEDHYKVQHIPSVNFGESLRTR